jgi:hypothetical protein
MAYRQYRVCSCESFTCTSLNGIVYEYFDNLTHIVPTNKDMPDNCRPEADCRTVRIKAVL